MPKARVRHDRGVAQRKPPKGLVSGNNHNDLRADITKLQHASCLRGDFK